MTTMRREVFKGFSDDQPETLHGNHLCVACFGLSRPARRARHAGDRGPGGGCGDVYGRRAPASRTPSSIAAAPHAACGAAGKLASSHSSPKKEVVAMTKRRIAASVLAGVLVCVLAACSAAFEAPESESTQTADAATAAGSAEAPEP